MQTTVSGEPHTFHYNVVRQSHNMDAFRPEYRSTENEHCQWKQKRIGVGEGGRTEGRTWHSCLETPLASQTWMHIALLYQKLLKINSENDSLCNIAACELEMHSDTDNPCLAHTPSHRYR